MINLNRLRDQGKPSPRAYSNSSTGAGRAPHHIPTRSQRENRLFTLWNYTVMCTQSLFKGFFMLYLGMMPIAMWAGSTIIVTNYLISFIGEDRALAFAAKRPATITFIALAYMTLTCGLGYWAWNTSVDKIDADFKAREVKHSKLFKVA